MRRFGRYSERKKRKSPFSTTPYTYLMPPIQRTPRNIHINLTLLETRILGLHFCRWHWQYVGSSANFRTVLCESQKRQLISFWVPNGFFTQNGYSGLFKVTYFGVSEETLRIYIVQYNNCGVECESSEDIAGEISENCHFRGPHSHLKPPG